MTKLLISVRNAEEAEIALAGGADVVDVKEPRRGALGPAEPRVWKDVARVVGSRAVTSVALGELRSDPVQTLASQTAGFDFAKIGLAGCRVMSGWKNLWQQTETRLPGGSRAVPVAYADCAAAESPSLQEVLELAASTAAKLLLIDTFDKTNGRLLEHLSGGALAKIARLAAGRGVALALAGSLQLNDMSVLLKLAPEYLGARGAACLGGRDGPIDLARVKSLAAIVHRENQNETSCCLTPPRARRILRSR